MVLIGDDPLLANGGHLVGEINSGEVSFNELFPDDAIDPDTTLDELNPVADDGSQLTLSFQGHTFVFDSVRPEKVQALLLMLGGEEMSSVSNTAVPFELNHRVSNYGPQSLNNPHRIASLMRYREKRKNLCFDKKIHYSIRSEVASRLKRHKGQFASAKANPEEAASTDPSSDSTERNCQEEKELPAFCQNCGISKDSTPLMRRGPAGPGSLCNACGLMWSNKGTVKNHLP